MTAKDSHELRSEAFATGSQIERTNCAHIFDDSTNHSVSTEGKKVGSITTAIIPTLTTLWQKDYAVTVWQILKHFGYEGVATALNGDGFHSLKNVMTMCQGVHSHFDDLLMWFEATVSKSSFQ